MTPQAPASPAPPLVLAVLPVLLLGLLLATAVAWFGDDTVGGPAQVALMLAGLAASAVGARYGCSWRDMEAGITSVTGKITPAIFLLLSVGLLVGVWNAAGVIPSMIAYGLQILRPEAFLPAAFVACVFVSMAIGSAWTTAGTVGVALMGIATASGVSPAVAAGAVISGAYFGDKMSPLSDTTNMASGVAEVDLFEHIRFLLWTTAPAFAIALVAFTIMSLFGGAVPDTSLAAELKAGIESVFVVSPLALVPLALTLGLAAMRIPPLLAIMAGAAGGVVVGLLLQFQGLAGEGGFTGALQALWRAAATGHVADTGVPALDELTSRGGMASMLSTVWLVLSAMFFGGTMERSGCLAAVVRALLSGATSDGALVRRVGLSAVGANLIASDQYMAVVVPGRMYQPAMDGAGLDRRNLSRALEDYGTVTSVLVPWNTCGAYMAATLGVSTLAYAPYAIFNWVSPLIAFAYSLIGFKILRAGTAPRSTRGATSGTVPAYTE